MVRIFSDFDGTITRGDVGDALFERFGGAGSVKAVTEYRDGRLSAVGCFQAECAACGRVDLRTLHDFLDSREIDETFPEFVSWCGERGYALMILSDGMDYYIDRILSRYGLGGVEHRSNHLELRAEADSGTAGVPDRVEFIPSFPHTDEVCDRCASCKRNHMLTLSADDDIIVYIGEGYSDRCPARYADMVFAKDDLIGWCRENSIPCYEYASFRDIAARIDRMVARAGAAAAGAGRAIAGLPRRRQAAIARRDVYLGG